jgi:hypothetical protein
MNDRLELVILQNWVLIGLLSLLLVLLVACGVMNVRNMRASRSHWEDPKRPNFSNLWETDAIDELLQRSEAHLAKYKNSSDALYFRGKALRRVGRDKEAKACFERLVQIEPSFRESIAHDIRDLSGEKAI